MTIKSIRVLARIDLPTGTVRIWDGTGPYLDGDGEVWVGAGLVSGLDLIEHAINAEAASLDITLASTNPQFGDLAWADTEEGDAIGSRLQILIQPCDAYDQPVGAAEVRFTGKVANLKFSEQVQGDEILSTLFVQVENRFNLRMLKNGAVLSDVDQRARSAVINPGANPDRFAERVSLLADKTIAWPKLTS